MFHNKYAAATAQLQESLKTHPQDARLHADYALVLNYQTKQTQALEQVLAAEKIAPGDAYVETIMAFKAALGLSRPVVMGCSIGGRVVRIDELERDQTGAASTPPAEAASSPAVER